MSKTEQKPPKFGFTALIIFIVVIVLYILLNEFVLTPVIEWLRGVFNW